MPKNLLSVGDNPTLATMMAEAKKQPILSHEEETRLAVQWRDCQVEAARTKLAKSHLRLVISIASKMARHGMSVIDLVGEGNLGLLRAIDKFEPERGFRLSTYAMYWIRAQIQEHILKNWSLVKLGGTADARRLFFQLRRIKQRLGIFEDVELSPNQAAAIAKESGTSSTDVIYMNRRLAGTDASLNVGLFDDDGGEWVDTLISSDPTPYEIAANDQQQSFRQMVIGGALDMLTPREKHIIEARHLGDAAMTLEQLGQFYGLTRERIRQIEAKALKKITAHIQASVPCAQTMLLAA